MVELEASEPVGVSSRLSFAGLDGGGCRVCVCGAVARLSISYDAFGSGHRTHVIELPFFCLPGSGSLLLPKLVSSNGLHLKSFLYPPQSTPRLAHCWQVGLTSSHFNRFALHVMQPVNRVGQRTYSVKTHFGRGGGRGICLKTPPMSTSETGAYHNRREWANRTSSPFLDFDCFRFVTALAEEESVVGAAFAGAEGRRFEGAGREAAGRRVGELRKTEGEGMVIVSAI